MRLVKASDSGHARESRAEKLKDGRLGRAFKALAGTSGIEVTQSDSSANQKENRRQNNNKRRDKHGCNADANNAEG
ncbi:hypothetical protein HYQ46_002317 [Verticillium longisporum]|nr:hypothetical protein HYQ46_002317 [Verticillium longisporum]